MLKFQNHEKSVHVKSVCKTLTAYDSNTILKASFSFFLIQVIFQCRCGKKIPSKRNYLSFLSQHSDRLFLCALKTFSEYLFLLCSEFYLCVFCISCSLQLSRLGCLAQLRRWSIELPFVSFLSLLSCYKFLFIFFCFILQQSLKFKGQKIGDRCEYDKNNITPQK